MYVWHWLIFSLSEMLLRTCKGEGPLLLGPASATRKALLLYLEPRHLKVDVYLLSRRVMLEILTPCETSDLWTTSITLTTKRLTIIATGADEKPLTHQGHNMAIPRTWSWPLHNHPAHHRPSPYSALPLKQDSFYRCLMMVENHEEERVNNK